MNSRSSANSTISSKRLCDLAPGQAEHDAVDEDVLAAGDFRVKAGAELDEGGDPPVDRDRAGRRFRDAGNDLERRALPGSVPADDAVGDALRYRERHVGQRRERFVGPKVAENAALQERALQRGELPAAVAPVDLRDVRQLDRLHTTSAKESRRRSNSQYPARKTPMDTAPRASSQRQ